MTPRFDSNLSAAYDYGMKLVLIEWVDSFGCSSNWQELTDDCQPKPIVCRSVGWLFRDGSNCKVIIPHIAEIHHNETKQGCSDMTIPSVAITRIVELVVPPNGKRKSARPKQPNPRPKSP